MKTKAHVRFLNRIAHLDADIELVDVFKIAIKQKLLSSKGSSYVLDLVNPQQHPCLAKRSNSDSSRSLAVNHLKATLCASYIKDIYEDMSQYFLQILCQAAAHGLDASRLLGEHKVSFDANLILKAGNWSSVVDMIATDLFRQLEREKSSKKLLKKINEKLDLGVSQDVIDASLLYIEMRHIIVHNDGKVDDQFCKSFPEYYAFKDKKLELDYATLQKAKDAITALIGTFDAQIVRCNAISPTEMQP